MFRFAFLSQALLDYCNSVFIFEICVFLINTFRRMLYNHNLINILFSGDTDLERVKFDV